MAKRKVTVVACDYRARIKKENIQLNAIGVTSADVSNIAFSEELIEVEIIYPTRIEGKKLHVQGQNVVQFGRWNGAAHQKIHPNQLWGISGQLKLLAMVLEGLDRMCDYLREG